MLSGAHSVAFSRRKTPPHEKLRPTPPPSTATKLQMSTQSMRRGVARAFYEGGYSWQTRWKRKASRVESPDNRARAISTDNPDRASRAVNPVSSPKRVARVRTITKRTRTATVNVALRSFFSRRYPLGSPGPFGWDFILMDVGMGLPGSVPAKAPAGRWRKDKKFGGPK